MTGSGEKLKVDNTGGVVDPASSLTLDQHQCVRAQCPEVEALGP
jgi:hypothetical protein